MWVEPFISEAIVSAIDSSNCSIISISGGWDESLPCDSNDPNRTTIELALQAAEQAGVLIVSAIGNGFDDLSDDCPPGTDNYLVTYPAYGEHVISVAAVDINDARWIEVEDSDARSGFANWCDISAPGVNIYTTSFNFIDGIGYDSYTMSSGTSLSAPFVAGLAGLILSYNSELSVNDVTNIIKTTSDDISVANSNEDWENKMGAGRINAYNIIDYIETAPDRPQNLILTESTNGHPQLNWDLSDEYDLEKYIIYRKLNNQSQYLIIDSVQKSISTYIDIEVNAGSAHDPPVCYKIQSIDIANNFSMFSNSDCIEYESVHRIISNHNQAHTFNTGNFYPNPFNGSTKITISTSENSNLDIRIFDILGQEVSLVKKTNLINGLTNIYWKGIDKNGNELPTGMYICFIYVHGISSGTINISKQKLILLK